MKEFHAINFLRDLVDHCASSEAEGKEFAADPAMLGPLLESALREFTLLTLRYEALKKEPPGSGQQLATNQLGEGATSMNDREFLEEFVRVKRTENSVQILVRKIRWEGPHTPISTWVTGRSLPDTASEAAIEKATASLLEDHRYFRTCLECGERKPFGWMNDERICQGCAEANHGVVH